MLFQTKVRLDHLVSLSGTRIIDIQEINHPATPQASAMYILSQDQTSGEEDFSRRPIQRSGSLLR